MRLDFEKGPIHPSPLGPSILTRAPGKVRRSGAHRDSVTTVRRRRGFEAAAFSGEGGAPVVFVDGGGVLQQGSVVTPRVTTSLITFISVLSMLQIHWLIKSHAD